jgi:hypothetical protein
MHIITYSSDSYHDIKINFPLKKRSDMKTKDGEALFSLIYIVHKPYENKQYLIG